MVAGISSIAPIQINPLAAASQALSVAGATAHNVFGALAESAGAASPAAPAAAGGVSHQAQGHHHGGAGASNSTTSTLA